MKATEGELIQGKKSTKYERWMDDAIIDVGMKAGSVAAMCNAIRVSSKETFYRWIERYPTFKEAYNTARLHAQEVLEEMLLAGACGKIKNFNFSATAMLLNNKFPDDYKRGTGSGGSTEINIGAINSIEGLDNKELDQKIEKLQRTLGLTQDREKVSVEEGPDD